MKKVQKKVTRSDLTNKRIAKALSKEKKQVKKKTKPNKVKPPTKNSKPKRKIRYKRLLLLLGLFILIFLFGFFLLTLRIKNIYISGNYYLKDQEIIEIAKIADYPSTLKNLSFLIESRLNKSVYIKKATVKKKGLFKVFIKVEENKPLFYYKPTSKFILKDGTKTDKYYAVPTLINQVPDKKYNTLLTKMALINEEIVTKISEIQYTPKGTDDNRFLFKMKDGNYVYINFDKFENLNNYIDIVKFLNNKKGILNLDAGNSFEIIEQG